MSAPRGVSAPRGGLLRGVSVPGGSAWGVSAPGGCLLQGVSALGVSAPGGCLLLGGLLWGGWYPSMH